MAALAVVEDLEVLEDRVGKFEPGAPFLRLSSSVCNLAQNDSIMPLS